LQPHQIFEDRLCYVVVSVLREAVLFISVMLKNSGFEILKFCWSRWQNIFRHFRQANLNWLQCEVGLFHGLCSDRTKIGLQLGRGLLHLLSFAVDRNCSCVLSALLNISIGFQGNLCYLYTLGVGVASV